MAIFPGPLENKATYAVHTLMIIGTAGHIDHGKTALLKALTGVDADRLQEEKRRGITIDLGYAYAPLPDGSILGFVDVPGHEKFIHNMLAGITGIDFALLVVAADDGIMPQTLEHVEILDLLEIRQGAVALTKIDLVDAARVEHLCHAIEQLLAGTSLKDAPIFPVSSLSGTGVAALRDHLHGAAAMQARHDHDGHFRLAIDRCFSLPGIGTVVTGTAHSGEVRRGERLMLSPSGIPVRVRGIHAQNQPAEKGVAGQRCALQLVGAEKQLIQRGDWVLHADIHAPTDRVDLRLRLLPGESKPMRHWTSVHAHLGAAHLTGHVALLESESLLPGTTGLAQLVLDHPVAALHGDLCILRDASAQRTLGGGRVLDSQPPARNRRKPERLAILRAWEQGDRRAILQALAEASPWGVDLAAFARNSNFMAEQTETLCDQLKLKRIAGSRTLAFSARHWETLQHALVQALQQEHGQTPDSLGLNSEQLRLRVAPQISRASFANVLNESLENGTLIRDGSWLHLPGHEIKLTETEEDHWKRLEPLLAQHPFQPPRVRDLARSECLDESVVRRLLMKAARCGRVYRIAHDHYLLRQAVCDLAALLCKLTTQQPHGAVLAADFRDAIGTGRKLAIHILEFFDRVGLTRRIKDTHSLRNDTLAF